MTLGALCVLGACGEPDIPPSCTNACGPAGRTECVADHVRTCTAVGACLVWSAPVSCPDGGVCSGAGVCGAHDRICTDACPSAGTTRCSGTLVQTCRENLYGCLAWGPPASCPTGSLCAQDACATCANDCTVPGRTRCSGTQVQTCTADAHGCLSWSRPAACPAGAFCAPDRCTVCDSTCAVAGATQCEAGQVQTCVADTHGCRTWSGAVSCPAGGACTGATAAGTCPNGQFCVDVSGSREFACVVPNTPAPPDAPTCTRGADAQCPAGFRCFPGGADGVCLRTCTVGGRCATCANTCSAPSATRCQGTQVQTCTADAAGCLSWSAAASCAEGTYCSGDRCVACEPGCAVAGETRCSGSQVQTCVPDARGCLVWSAAAPCPAGGYCEGGRCRACEHACAAGQTQCFGTQVQTCTADARGCRTWSAPAACPAGGHCAGATQAGTCPSGGVCLGLSGFAQYECYAPGGADPAGAASCTPSQPGSCPAGFRCLPRSATAGVCLRSCTVGGACVACQNECTAPGAIRCSGTLVQACVGDENGCLSWSEPVACGSGAACSGDQCVGCEDECGWPGATRCAGAQVQTCVERADGCLSWSVAAPCPSGYCSADKCRTCNSQCAPEGATQCSGREVQTCTADANGCLAWTRPAVCAAGSVCSGWTSAGDCPAGQLCSDASALGASFQPPPVGQPAIYECLSAQGAVPAGAATCTQAQAWQCPAGSRCFLTGDGANLCLRDCTWGGRCTARQTATGATGAAQLDDLCAKRAAAACGLLARCHTPLLGTSVDTCTAGRTAECLQTQADVRAAVLAGRAGVDAAKRDRCLQAIAAARCGAEAAQIDATCADVVAGHVAPAGACYDGAECVQGACDLSSCPGACRAGVAGDACGAGLPACADGLYCDAGVHRCVPRRTTGACRADGECAEGYACSGGACVACGAAGQACCGQPKCGPGLDCVSGTCRAAGGAGSSCDHRARQSCAPALACVVSSPSALAGTCGTPLAAGANCWFGWSCAAGLACVGANPAGGVQGRCATPVATGGTCRIPTGDATGDCAPGAYCDGVCRVYAARGATCGTGLPRCEDGLFCVSGRCGGLPTGGQPCLPPSFCAEGFWCNALRVCAPLKTAGQSCSANTECASTVCDRGTCTRLMAAGEACVGGLQCTTGLCENSICRAPCRP